MLGVQLGAPSLVGHWEGAVDAQSDLPGAELGQGRSESFCQPYSSQEDSCTCTPGCECPSEPCTLWGSPRPCWWGPGVLMVGFCLSWQWRTRHTVSSPTCGTSSSGQCPVPEPGLTCCHPGQGHSPAGLGAAAALLCCSIPPPIHPSIPAFPPPAPCHSARGGPTPWGLFSAAVLSSRGRGAPGLLAGWLQLTCSSFWP